MIATRTAPSITRTPGLKPVPAEAPVAPVTADLKPLADRTPSDILELLVRPFRPEVYRTRPIPGNQTYRYVPVGAVVERLNKACPWQWRIEDVQILVMPLRRAGALVDTPVMHVRGELTIPGLGSRQAIGTAPCEGTEDACKAAESDAIKRAAELFGVPV